ncbi:MAG: Ig-like domain-containing protein, partial [Prevotellaceae bacterium]|nr:Ig-like domain-containing protein [Prevotellaceae bacterium]
MKKIIKKAGGICLLFFGVLCVGCADELVDPVVVTQVVVSETVVTLDPGETVQLTATVTPDNAGNRTVFWKSMNDKIATVDNGLIRAEAPGTVTIVALAYSNAEARSEVTVTVTGVPEDLAAAVAGTYIGDVTMGGSTLATDVEATLT